MTFFAFTHPNKHLRNVQKITVTSTKRTEREHQGVHWVVVVVYDSQLCDQNHDRTGYPFEAATSTYLGVRLVITIRLFCPHIYFTDDWCAPTSGGATGAREQTITNLLVQ